MQVEGLLKKQGESLRLHASADLSNLIRLAGVYVQFALTIGQEKGVEVNINMNHIEDA